MCTACAIGDNDFCQLVILQVPRFGQRIVHRKTLYPQVVDKCLWIRCRVQYEPIASVARGANSAQVKAESAEPSLEDPEVAWRGMRRSAGLLAFLATALRAWQRRLRLPLVDEPDLAGAGPLEPLALAPLVEPSRPRAMRG